MESRNPFRELEPDVVCPPRLKGEIFSEIDFIRNVLKVVKVYAYDIFAVHAIALGGKESTTSDEENQR